MLAFRVVRWIGEQAFSAFALAFGSSTDFTAAIPFAKRWAGAIAATGGTGDLGECEIVSASHARVRRIIEFACLASGMTGSAGETIRVWDCKES